ncbi:hypothetical protein DUNSADRAFT_14779 [Dunaliella salina]|uniref:Encoded protein n=1 Tax=Dunaliella salina TaxID=3046 RepID=A0ABQ7G6Q6_DUNSA|nr:hypothetical protein DUNSADRAFT_14779 [Dunaliella salina]|eukprot:KAF5830289.1 hypothetical protein DUNSADRAFT_14779 [Dunaliella salina]
MQFLQQPPTQQQPSPQLVQPAAFEPLRGPSAPASLAAGKPGRKPGFLQGGQQQQGNFCAASRTTSRLGSSAQQVAFAEQEGVRTTQAKRPACSSSRPFLWPLDL